MQINLRLYRNTSILGKTHIVVLLHLVLILLLWIFNSSAQIPIITILSSVMGFLALIVIPGLLLSSVLLPAKLDGLSSSIILGFSIIIIQIQSLYNLKLIFVFQVRLIHWLCMSSLFLVFGLFLLCISRERSSVLVGGLSKALPKEIMIIMLFGAALRIILSVFTEGVISPDGALYSDFARNMLNGEFMSNILDDPAVQTLSNGVQHIRHQGIVYFYALSQLLIPAGTSSPTILLTIIGLLLIPISYSISEHFFGKRSGVFASILISTMPAFVFHSVVGYGPSITSLMFLMCSILFLAKCDFSSIGAMLAAGLFFGFVEMVWYPNFYIGCLALPFIIFVRRDHRIGEKAIIYCSFLLLLMVRLVFYSPIVYYGGWILIFVLLQIQKRKREAGAEPLSVFFLGIATVMTFWRWPFHVFPSGLEGQAASASFTQLLDGVLAPIQLEMIIRFALFLLFHLTPILWFLLSLTVFARKNQSQILPFIAVGVISLIGTLKILSTIPESLKPIYLFSDSRFFILMLAMFILAGTAVVSESQLDLLEKFPFEKIPSFKSRRNAIVLSLIAICITPGYLALPSGIALVDIEDRYGWKDIAYHTSFLGNDDTVFLADRAREFAWFTSRLTATFNLSARNLPESYAIQEFIPMQQESLAAFLIIDGYTIQRWGTLNYLLEDQMEIGDSVLLDVMGMTNFLIEDSTTNLMSMSLRVQTNPTESGRISRIYQFSSHTFHKVASINILDGDWQVSNDASINNSTGLAQIVLTTDGTASVSHIDDFSLDLDVSTGIILVELDEMGAEVTGITIRDDDNPDPRFLNEIDSGLFLCSFGRVTIEDIEIQISGSAGNALLIESISIWSA